MSSSEEGLGQRIARLEGEMHFILAIVLAQMALTGAIALKLVGVA